MAPELLQVLRGLQLNREPGWNFPGNFLELSFDEVGADFSRLSLEPGPHCIDERGQVHLAALTILADIGVSACMRTVFGLDTRMATVALNVQFTGAPAIGRLEQLSHFDASIGTGTVRQGMGTGRLHAGSALVATVNGSFIALGNKTSLANLPTRRRGEYEVAALEPEDLVDAEIDTFARAQAAVQGAGHSFLSRFWGLLPTPTDHGATAGFDNGLQVGNRMGHTQGGISFAMAALTACAALGDDWRLVGVHGSYIAAGTATRLRATATIVHQGRTPAVVRPALVDADGRVVIETTSNHSRLD
ncbi:hypothetical protein BH10PSE17_BH10PSE17_32690 [soil metagenome]